MADYAIGDVQGCFDSLQALLDKLQFNEHHDRLWFVGDLVNRGPKSLEVLRFVKNLPIPARVCLGNHDLHLLDLIYAKHPAQNHDSTLELILQAEDCEDLGAWLIQQPLLWHDSELNIVMVHAGIAPQWTLAQAKLYAQELEIRLRGPDRLSFFNAMYGNQPNLWSTDLTGIERLRLICNYFTRMRFCLADGSLDFQHDGRLDTAPSDLYPWYNTPKRKPLDIDVIFGHWSALDGQCSEPHLYALDTGCVWGGTLTALRLQDKCRISVLSQERKKRAF